MTTLQSDSAAQAALRTRHRDYYLALAEEVGPAIDAAEKPLPLLETLDAEAGNLRAALAWSAVQADGSLARMLVALQPWFYRRQLHREENEWLRQALAAPPEALRATLLLHVGLAEDALGHGAAALETFDAARAAADELGQPEVALIASMQVGWLHFFARTLREAAQAFERVVDAGPAATPVSVYLHALRGQGWVALLQGDPDRALACHVEAERLARASGRRDVLANHLEVHANLSNELDRWADCIRFADEACELFRQLGDPEAVASNRCLAGDWLLSVAERDAAVAAFEEALAMTRDPLVRANALHGVANVAARRGDTDRAELLAAEGLAELCNVAAQGRDQAWARLALLGVLVRVARDRGDVARADAIARERRSVANDLSSVAVARADETLAQLALDRGDSSTARARFETAVRDMRSVPVAGLRGDLAELESELVAFHDDTASAVAVLEAAIAGAPETLGAGARHQLFARLALLQVAAGDTEAARGSARLAVEVVTGLAGYQYFVDRLLAEVAAATPGRGAEARRHLAASLDTGVGDRDRVLFLELLAEAALSDGDTDRAAALLATVIAERVRLSYAPLVLSRERIARVRAAVDGVGAEPLDPAEALRAELHFGT